MFSGCHLAFSTPTARREMSLRERDRIVEIAQIGARARSNVPRDPYTREVVDVPDLEVATRMTAQLSQLYLGMEYIGVTEEDCWRAIRRVAMDSMPAARRAVLEAIMSGTGLTAEIAEAVKISGTACGRVVEDLGLLGVVEKDERTNRWVVGEWVRERLERIDATGELRAV